MKTMRLAATAVFSAILLGAAGTLAAAEKVTIQIWQGFNAEETAVFKELMKDFEEEWKDKTGQSVEVRDQYVSFGDMFTKLRTAALAKRTPDVAFVDAIKVTDLAFGRALYPIDEMKEFKERYGTIEKARTEFVPASFNAGVVNRKGETHLYGMPVQTTTVALFWNREIFRNKAQQLRAAGLDPNRAPQDWDEMTAYGQVLTDATAGIYGYGMSGSLWFNFPIFNMYGVGFVEYKADGTAVPDLETPNGRAALERLRTLTTSGIEGGAWKRSALSPEAGFLNKKYAMVLTGPWNFENFTNAGLDFEISLIPAPTAKEVDELGLEPVDPSVKDTWGGLAYSSSNVGGQTGVIMRTSQHPEVAYALLEFFTREDTQREWATTLGQIPTRLAAWEGIDLGKYPHIPKFMDQLRLAKRIPQIPRYGILESDIYNPEIDLFLQNASHPATTTLKNMAAKMKAKIFDDMNAALDAAD